ncbi:cytochrome P450 4c3-like [Brevipalpus obovatus]|uniref:cytochrome P450 4c3-like n=1 Tax=Brevipalpus obovatus TaxID=246614 RepID=UPI003D9DE5BE
MRNYLAGDISSLITWCFKTFLAVLLVNTISFVIHKIYLCLKLRNVPHRKSHFLLGDLERVWKTDLTDPARAFMKLENDAYREFADKKLRINWNFWTPFLMIYNHEGAADILTKKNFLLKGIDYECIKPWTGDGLLTSVSTKWHARRKLITPAFHFDILDHFAPVMVAHTREFLEFLSAKSSQNSDDWIKIDEHLSSFTLDVLLETAMGLMSEDLKDLRPSYVDSVKILGKYLFKRDMGIISRYDCLYYHTDTGKKVKKALETVHNFSNRAIQNRIEYLKSIQHESSDENSQESSELTAKKRKKRALMDLLISAYLDPNETSVKDSEDIREEVDTFMFAGHDTTASAIGWLILILGNYPEVQERLWKELESCFDRNEIDHNKILSNRYLDACVKEGMRLISPVPGIGKTLPEDTEICGHMIPKGVSLIIFFFYMHRDPKLYPDPLKFKPERFLDQETRLPFSFVPFSAGPRNCIGQKFALMEIKIFIALLIHQFKLTSKVKVEDVEYCFEVVTRPIDSLEIKFEEKH